MLAAEVSASSPDFGHLEPMVKATKRELRAIGVTETPGVALADSGYWNEEQIDNVVANEHVQVLIPPTPASATHPARMGWRTVHIDARDTSERLRRRAIHKTKGDGRAGVRTDQAQPADQSVSATRRLRRALRMAADHRHRQPAEAPQAPDGRRSGLKDRPGSRRAVGQHLGPRNTARRLPIVATSLATTVVANLCATPTTSSRRSLPSLTRYPFETRAAASSCVVGDRREQPRGPIRGPNCAKLKQLSATQRT